MTHWAERVVAEFLDANGIAWVYEPKTFVLSRFENGDPASGFCPDFYLPDYDLFVEVTVQKPCTRKNKKVRQLRELRPDVCVRLLNKGDVSRLAKGEFELHELFENVA